MRRQTIAKISWGRKVAITHFLVTTRMWQDEYCASDSQYAWYRFLSPLMSSFKKRRRHQNHNKGSKKLQRRKTNNSFLGWDTSLEQVTTRCPPPMGRKRHPHTHWCHDRKSEFYRHQCTPLKMSDLYPRTTMKWGYCRISYQKPSDNTRKVPPDKLPMKENDSTKWGLWRKWWK